MATLLGKLVSPKKVASSLDYSETPGSCMQDAGAMLSPEQRERNLHSAPRGIHGTEGG